MAILTLRIDNMHCGSCVRRVTQTLNALPETHADEVRVGSARISTTAAPEQIQQALTAAGYPALVEFSAEAPAAGKTPGA
jgi:copper chaperone